MIDITEFKGEGWKIVAQYEGWKIGFLRFNDRFSKFRELERHKETDEVFVLLKGRATLYLKDDKGEISKYKMQKCKVYNIHKNVWHHITVSRNATVMVVENSNTTKENTEKETALC